jgi:hypothetical protein
MKFDKYGSIVKKNFVSTIEEDPVLSTFKEFLTNEDALKMIVANPLGSVSTMIATSLIPITLKRSIQRLDESIGNFFPALFGKIGRSAKNYDNQLLQTLGKIFGLRVEDRSQIDYSKYEKGAVPFDGTVHKAITTVIPKYLSEILSALTGKEAINFDYEKGEFATNRQMAKRIQDDEKNTRLGAYYKQINEMEKMMERMTFQNMKKN